MQKNNRRKIIALTGVPGCGKTTLLKMLAGRIGGKIEFINISDFIKENKNNPVYKFYVKYDKERDCDVVDVNNLKRAVSSAISSEYSDKDIIIDGHLSVFFEATHVVVLRTRPDVLKKRLEKRGYTKEKIKENLESEVVGLCLYDALERNCKNIMEIDTTGGIDEDMIVGIIKWINSTGGMNLLDRDRIEKEWIREFYEIIKNAG